MCQSARGYLFVLRSCAETTFTDVNLYFLLKPKVTSYIGVMPRSAGVPRRTGRSFQVICIGSSLHPRNNVKYSERRMMAPNETITILSFIRTEFDLLSTKTPATAHLLQGI